VGCSGQGGGSSGGRRHSPPQTQHRDRIKMAKGPGEIAIEDTSHLQKTRRELDNFGERYDRKGDESIIVRSE
jgi:hypothetical protein